MNRQERRKFGHKTLTGLKKLVSVDGRKLRVHKTDILFAMPTYRSQVELDTKKSMHDMIIYMKNRGYRTANFESDGALIAKSRNEAVINAREMDAEWLMFIDSDMTFAPHYVEMLLNHNKDVVSGLCVRRVPPFNATIYFYRDDVNRYVLLDEASADAIVLNSLLKCDATGTAFMLIRMSVFDKLERPYFAMPPSGEGLMGEDLYFCTKMREAGYEIYVDTGLLIGHIGTYPFTYLDRLDYLAYQKEYGGEQRTAAIEGGVRAHTGGGVSSLLRTAREAKGVPPVVS